MLFFYLHIVSNDEAYPSKKRKLVMDLSPPGLTMLTPIHHHQVKQLAPEPVAHLSILPLLQQVLLALQQTQSLPIPFKSLKTLS